jgi:hypothetical protein
MRRQAVSRDVGHVAPWVGLVAVLAGAGLLLYAVPRLKRQEGKDDERLEAELARLKRDITPQDAAERRARIEAEAAEASDETEADGVRAEQGDEAERDSDVGAETEPDDDASNPTEDLMAKRAYEQAALMERVADAEEGVLRQIARIAPPLYQLRPQVKVGGAGPVQLDGLLVSQIDQLPDIVIEIKFVRDPSHLARRLRGALYQLRAKLAGLDLRGTRGWLIIVTEGEATAPQLERSAKMVVDSGDDVIVSVTSMARIGELELPRDRFI